MKKEMVKQDFDFYIDEYMYHCQSRRLRPKTMNSYEQSLRLFERWAREQEGIERPAEVKEQTPNSYVVSRLPPVALQRTHRYSHRSKPNSPYQPAYRTNRDRSSEPYLNPIEARRVKEQA